MNTGVAILCAIFATWTVGSIALGYKVGTIAAAQKVKDAMVRDPEHVARLAFGMAQAEATKAPATVWPPWRER